jgi:hypothetical protein
VIYVINMDSCRFHPIPTTIPDNPRRCLHAHAQRVRAVGAVAAVLQHEEDAVGVGVTAVDNEEQAVAAGGQQREQLAHIGEHVRCGERDNSHQI